MIFYYFAQKYFNRDLIEKVVEDYILKLIYVWCLETFFECNCVVNASFYCSVLHL
jgi:hypothetical protein